MLWGTANAADKRERGIWATNGGSPLGEDPTRWKGTLLPRGGPPQGQAPLSQEGSHSRGKGHPVGYPPPYILPAWTAAGNRALKPDSS